MAETPDSHDLDKLTKWQQGLASETGGPFPVCALFLVSAVDRRAHDIFRVYRRVFEELGAGFHDLVIFGQHGVSSTSSALVPGLGLSGLRTPSLTLAPHGSPPVCFTAVLPGGALAEGEVEEDGDDVPWRNALEIVKRTVRDGSPLSLDGVAGLTRNDLPSGGLAELVGQVRHEVEGSSL